MGDNGKLVGKVEGLSPTAFGGLLESALSNMIVQFEAMDKRLLDIEEYIQDDIKRRATAGRMISDN
jgi:hypothetical protein